MTRQRSIVAIAMVNRRGDVLLQLRSPDARVSPSCWTPPGGHLEPGESPEAAVRRELREETTLELPGEPLLYWHGLGIGRSRGVEARLYAAATTATDADVTCLEGAAMEFRSRAEIGALPLADLYGPAMLRFLGSSLYYRLGPV